jgi:hypothetical protein
VKRMKRTATVVGVLLLGIASVGTAQQASTVFDIEPGVRMLGAGSAGLSVASGAETLYHNPAAMSLLPGISFSSSYTSYLGMANYSAFSLTLRNWGLAALMLGSGGIEGYDEAGVPTESLSYRNTGILLGVGLDPGSIPFLSRLGSGFSLGMRVKYLSARMAGEAGTGFAIDLGFLTAFPSFQLGPVSVTDTAFGATMVNLLGGVSYDGERDRFLTDLQMGASARLANAVLLAVDLHFGGSSHVGLVYAPVPTFELRLGVISKRGVTLTFGAGVNVEGFLLDYAYAGHRLGGTHRVSLTLDFNNLDVAALRNSFRRILR